MSNGRGDAHAPAREANSGIVYIVDDDASMRTALERMFRAGGFTIEAFESPEAFLKHDSQRWPCCAVLDLRMPGIDGLTLHERLVEAGRALPVVFITAYGDIPTTVRAMKRGAIDFIEKPFESAEIIAAVRRALQASREAEEERVERASIEARVSSLTPREREVFALVVEGLLNKLIADRLGTAEKTVKVHRGRVMEKMEARSVAELVRMAERIHFRK